MTFLLDTDICVHVIRHRPPDLTAKLSLCPAGTLVVSVITVSELAYGAHKSKFPEKNLVALNGFLRPLRVLPFSSPAAQTYGEIRAELERKGQTIGPLDLLIAAHAVSIGANLVTFNTREFERVPGLSIERWG